jgi:hypothetical protein
LSTFPTTRVDEHFSRNLGWGARPPVPPWLRAWA